MSDLSPLCSTKADIGGSGCSRMGLRGWPVPFDLPASEVVPSYGRPSRGPVRASAIGSTSDPVVAMRQRLPLGVHV